MVIRRGPGGPRAAAVAAAVALAAPAGPARAGGEADLTAVVGGAAVALAQERPVARFPRREDRAPLLRRVVATLLRSASGDDPRWEQHLADAPLDLTAPASAFATTLLGRTGSPGDRRDLERRAFLARRYFDLPAAAEWASVGDLLDGRGVAVASPGRAPDPPGAAPSEPAPAGDDETRFRGLAAEVLRKIRARGPDAGQP